eukprot:CAMPEP_0115077662 /NCGR_PEP_ID=MMETSP0227-20121206/17124_1 /TAXON_ID=89957 /ORGANISM="Polarella glacialis, Strain CCMP 1383" /LENGTH=102 /DNA_ID=CAMNT_0002464973 /DNA_START=1810 /DNA_END=2117 /DNA_ORIENTATION=+
MCLLQQLAHLRVVAEDKSDFAACVAPQTTPAAGAGIQAIPSWVSDTWAAVAAGSDPGGFAGQAIFVQPAAALEPSVGQLQVLQPSSAVKGRPGQQEASLGDE